MSEHIVQMAVSRTYKEVWNILNIVSRNLDALTAKGFTPNDITQLIAGRWSQNAAQVLNNIYAALNQFIGKTFTPQQIVRIVANRNSTEVKQVLDVMCKHLPMLNANKHLTSNLFVATSYSSNTPINEIETFLKKVSEIQEALSNNGKFTKEQIERFASLPYGDKVLLSVYKHLDALVTNGPFTPKQIIKIVESYRGAPVEQIDKALSAVSTLHNKLIKNGFTPDEIVWFVSGHYGYEKLKAVSEHQDELVASEHFTPEQIMRLLDKRIGDQAESILSAVCKHLDALIDKGPFTSAQIVKIVASYRAIKVEQIEHGLSAVSKLFKGLIDNGFTAKQVVQLVCGSNGHLVLKSVYKLLQSVYKLKDAFVASRRFTPEQIMQLLDKRIGDQAESVLSSVSKYWKVLIDAGLTSKEIVEIVASYRNIKVEQIEHGLSAMSTHYTKLVKKGFTSNQIVEFVSRPLGHLVLLYIDTLVINRFTSDQILQMVGQPDGYKTLQYAYTRWVLRTDSPQRTGQGEGTRDATQAQS